MEASQVRSLLPQAEQENFDDIVLQRVLGASKHISMIGDMLRAIASKYREVEGDTAAMLEDLLAVADYFKATRGQASSAIGNAIDFMMRGMRSLGEMPVAEAARAVEASVNAYSSDAHDNIEKLTGYAVSLSKGMRRILVFDYSSTVNRFLARLGQEQPGIEVFIPESRIINGGYAFVPTSLSAGLKVHFIPDAAIMYYLKDCDAAYFGAETYNPDGTAYNTTGSDLVGLVCREYHVPLYILTPLIKLDTRPLQGYVRKLVNNNTREKLCSAGFTAKELESVDFDCPELLPVGPEFIAAFITECGVIPTAGMYAESVRYAKFLTGGDDL